jgi:metallo-beta-lactamase class B
MQENESDEIKEAFFESLRGLKPFTSTLQKSKALAKHDPSKALNIESLGFELEDVKILLTMQAHWDHTAALAEIKQITGAQMWATAGDAPVLEDGGFSDPHFGGKVSFKPVSVGKIVTDGDVIELGETRLRVVETPGHTAGSSSYTMRMREAGREYNVVIANMGTINPGKRLVVNPTYPDVAEDFAETFRKQKALEVDVWVAAHGSQYGLHSKYKPGQPYSPDTFLDPKGFLAAVERLEKLYREQIAAERR